MDRIPETGLDFKDFEKWSFDMGMAFARMLMETALESLDDKIMKERDKSVYRARDLRRLTIKTLMGEIEIKRRLYRTDDGGYVCLLDESIGLDTTGRMSVNLVRHIAETVTECSYRSTADAVSAMTGQRISHGGVWNVVQATGEKIRKNDENNAKLAKIFPDRGKKTVKVLHEEFDGVWINMQGKDRPEKGRKSEMKLSVCYEGMECKGKDSKGNTVYDMVNPMYMAGFEDVGKFREKKEGMIGSVYNLDEIEVRLVNGDGGGWVRSAAESCGENVHIQLDPFHIKREITGSGLSKEQRKEITGLLESGKISEVHACIGAVMQNEPDADRKEKIRKLSVYLENNGGYLIPVKKRSLNLPDPPDGIIYGGMGVMESSVCNIAALRMKKRKASFTKDGAVNLARLICFKRSGRLADEVYGLSKAQLPMIIEEVITTVLSAARAPKKDGKGYAYPVSGGLPFSGAAVTNGRKAVKGLTDLRSFTELIFR